MIKVYESNDSLILYHASESELKDFDLCKSKELGLHAGTKRAAHDRSKGFINKDFHLYELRINSSSKFITLGDEVYSWTSPNVLRFIINNYPDIIEEKMYKEYRNKLADMNEYQKSKFISDIIFNAGYDGIKYTNEIEDPGSTSYIIINKDIIESIKEKEI